jgi:hypothetical protein
MNGFVMFFGVIGSAMVLFAGVALERYLAPVRAAVSFLALLLAARAWVLYPESLDLQDISSIGRSLFAGELGTLAIVLLFSVVLAILSQRFAARFISIAGVPVLTIVYLLVVLIATGLRPPLLLAGVITAGGAAASLLWALFDQDSHRLWTTSIAGGTMVSLLFTRFYYLPAWLFVMLALALTLIGRTAQGHGKPRETRGKEQS